MDTAVLDAELQCLRVRILLAESDAELRDGLRSLLEGEDHEITPVSTGAEAEKRVARGGFELVLLACELSDGSGLELCEDLRAADPALPIMMLTGTAPESRAAALDAGADDAVTFPANRTQMVSRVRAIGRRAALVPRTPEVVEIDGCRLDFANAKATRGKSTEALSAHEVGLLRWLHRHAGRAVPREELLENVWGLPPTLVTRSVDVAVAALRKKIERDPKQPRIVVTTKGAGYSWGA